MVSLLTFSCVYFLLVKSASISIYDFLNFGIVTAKGFTPPLFSPIKGNSFNFFHLNKFYLGFILVNLLFTLVFVIVSHSEVISHGLKFFPCHI